MTKALETTRDVWLDLGKGKRRVLAAALAVTLMLSILGTSFAWYDSTQHKVSAFVGTADSLQVILHKGEVDADGNILAGASVSGAKFTLWRENTDGQYTLVNNTLYETDAGGNIYFDGSGEEGHYATLVSGKYYFEETYPGYGYTYTKETDADGNVTDKTRWAFEITEDESAADNKKYVDAYNQRMLGTLVVSNTVTEDGVELPSGERGKTFKFKIAFSDGRTVYRYKIAGSDNYHELGDGMYIYLEGGQTAVFDTLPVGLKYQITEINDSGYFVQSTGSSGSIPVAAVPVDENGYPVEGGAPARAEAAFNNLYSGYETDGNLTIKNSSTGAVDPQKLFYFTVSFGDGNQYPYTVPGGESVNENGGNTNPSSSATPAPVSSPTPTPSKSPMPGASTTPAATATPKATDAPKATTAPEATPGPTAPAVTAPPEVTATPSEESQFDTASEAARLLRRRLSVNRPASVFGSVGGIRASSIGRTVTTLEDEEQIPLAVSPIGAGDITIALKANQEAIFSDLPAGLTYTITETPTEGYTTSVSQMFGQIPAGGSIDCSFRNVPMTMEQTGDLKITNATKGDGASSTYEFAYRITVKGKDGLMMMGDLGYTLNGAENTFVLTNGIATFSLKDGDELVIPNLEAGSTYLIEEANAENYVASRGQYSGTIAGGAKSYVDFINYYSNTALGETTLSVNNTIVNADELPEYLRNKEFSFTLVIEGEDNQQFTLKTGESKSFVVKSGKGYSIVEDDYFKQGFVNESIVNGTGTTGTTQTIDVLVTNKYVGTMYAEFSGNRTWYGADGEAIPTDSTLLPESVMVDLIDANGAVAARCEATRAEGYAYRFIVPKYDNMGAPIQYTVKETQIDELTTDDAVPDGTANTEAQSAPEAAAAAPELTAEPAETPAADASSVSSSKNTVLEAFANKTADLTGIISGSASDADSIHAPILWIAAAIVLLLAGCVLLMRNGRKHAPKTAHAKHGKHSR